MEVLASAENPEVALLGFEAVLEAVVGHRDVEVASFLD